MQFVVRNLRKFFRPVKTRPRIFLVAFAVALILAGWKFWDFHREVSHTYIQISMKSSIDGTAQLYYDVGNGFSEADSVAVAIVGNRNFHDYQFRLPSLPVYGIRFDPLTSEGSVTIRHVQWMDGLGAVMQIINLKLLLPLNQIGSFSFTDQGVEVVTNQNVDDPQIGVQLSRPLMVGKIFFFWRHPTVILRILIEFVLVFFVIMLLLSFWFNWRRNIALLPYGGKIPFAMLLAFLAVITIEIIQQAKLPAVASYHEVDDLLYQLQKDRFQADYVLLGSSVGRQLFKYTPYLQNEKFAMMATNQAVTMTGQYFIAKRYLKQNKIPRAFILLTDAYFNHLDQYLADNYFQRTFTNISEIFEILHLKKDPVFTAKTFAYRVLPSFKYRLFLQKQLVNFTNAESYTGIPYGSNEMNIAKYSLLHILQSYMQKENITRHHFISMLSLLNDMQIPLLFLAPAMSENNIEAHREYQKICVKLFPEWQKKYPNFYYDNKARILQAKYYIDGVHFNEAGLKIESQYLHEQIVNFEKLLNSMKNK